MTHLGRRVGILVVLHYLLHLVAHRKVSRNLVDQVRPLPQGDHLWLHLFLN